MIVVMKYGASEEQISAVVGRIEQSGCEAHIDRGVERAIIGIRSGRHDLTPELFLPLPGVADAVRILKPFKLASREFHPSPTRFSLGCFEVAEDVLGVIAGPCSVEGRQQMKESAAAVKSAGAHALRGGAFKPRSSPYAFQGLGEEGLKLLKEAGDEVGLPVVTEVMHPGSIELVARYADILQIGARNMQNYDLLRDVAAAGKPVFLKRGMAAKVEDLLMSAEYLLDGGCDRVILCERGIRTFETATRNTLDISVIPVIKKLSHLPVYIDPSHASGYAEYVAPLALAAVAAGADGLMIEVHPRPEEAKSDGPQSLTPTAFHDLMELCRRVAGIVGRRL